MKQRSIGEALAQHLYKLWREYKVPLLSSVIAAALAYMFIVTNKIVNWDDMQFLFGKGYTLTSGRWGLDLIEYILPNYSMPWLWGVLSVVLISWSICIIIRIFDIKSKILQGVLAAAVMVFPSQIGTMFYMFTSSSYAVAFLMAVSSVYLYTRGGKIYKLVALLLCVLTCSIYQAYIAITASFFVLLAIQSILRNEEPAKDIFKRGMGYLLFLAVALAIYYGITQLILHCSGNELNGWATRAMDDSTGVISRAVRSWKLFAAMFVFRTYGLITTYTSQLAHIVCAAATVVAAFVMVIKRRDILKILLFVLLVGVLLPLSINCIVLLLGENGVHALTLYGFISVYILAIIVVEQISIPQIKNFLKDLTFFALVLIIASNIYTANKAYLKQYLVYENTFAFYESIATQIQMTEGFDENTEIAVIGNVAQDSEYLDQFGEDVIYGLCGFKGEAISDDFITYYLGFDMVYADSEEKEQLKADSRVQAMNAYPYYGYVQKIDNYIVVKIGE